MQITTFEMGKSRSIQEYGSQAAAVLALARFQGPANLVRIQLAAGGLLGAHPAAQDQLFIVTSGQGEVCGGDGVFLPISAGQAALWRQGEQHTTRSTPGLTALVLEADEISLRV